jgi:hypothetical protein
MMVEEIMAIEQVFLQSISLLKKVKSLQLKWAISGDLEKKRLMNGWIRMVCSKTKNGREKMIEILHGSGDHRILLWRRDVMMLKLGINPIRCLLSNRVNEIGLDYLPFCRNKRTQFDYFKLGVIAKMR